MKKGRPKRKKRAGRDPEWAKAKKLCRLNAEDVRMAKALGFKPKSLMKNIPSGSQPWKAPVKAWIRDLHEKRFGAGGGERRAAASRRRDEEPVPSADEHVHENGPRRTTSPRSRNSTS